MPDFIFNTAANYELAVDCSPESVAVKQKIDYNCASHSGGGPQHSDTTGVRSRHCIPNSAALSCLADYFDYYL